jgi:hypothetical protein
MIFRKIALATAAATLAAAPVVAQANLEVATAPIEGESEVAGGSGIIIGILAAAAIIAGIVIVADDDDDEGVSL